MTAHLAQKDGCAIFAQRQEAITSPSTTTMAVVENDENEVKLVWGLNVEVLKAVTVCGSDSVSSNGPNRDLTRSRELGCKDRMLTRLAGHVPPCRSTADAATVLSYLVSSA